MDKPSADKLRHYLVRVDLDERSLAPASAEIEHERKIAIYDLLQENVFRPVGPAHVTQTGPYALHLSNRDGRLVFALRTGTDIPIAEHHLSMAPLRKIIKDYFVLCDSYYDAIRSATIEQIETIDMARRSMHNEGSEILKSRLTDKVAMDFDTSRRLFTLICSFFMR